MNNVQQSPQAVVMVRPHYFSPNPETAKDNVFQQDVDLSLSTINTKAFTEVNNAIDTLRSHGIEVHVFDDETTKTPDSVFPNNWFTTHENGAIGIYPMYCHNRRKEINLNIIDFLAQNYVVNRLIDYSSYAEKGQFLEGTGAMVLDHENRLAYAVKSNRMSDDMLNNFAQDFNYTPIIFNASDENGVPVYHTNVLMCIASQFAMISLDMIKDNAEKAHVIKSLNASNKEIIDLSLEQIKQFAGNALELKGPNGNILAISQTAYNALTDEQILQIENYTKIVAIDVSTIELAGGSIRCMLAGIHLPKST